MAARPLATSVRVLFREVRMRDDGAADPVPPPGFAGPLEPAVFLLIENEQRFVAELAEFGAQLVPPRTVPSGRSRRW